MKRITGFRMRSTAKVTATSQPAPLPPPVSDVAARDRVLAKIRSMGEPFFKMSESEYGEWLNALPRAEFIELIALNCESAETA